VAPARGIFGGMLKHVLDYWLPSRCALCGLSGGELCVECSAELSLNNSCCPLCALPLPAPLHGHACGACVKRPPPFSSAFAPFVYDFPIDGLIRRFKFSRELHIGRLLAEGMAAALAQQDFARPDLLIPLPLGADRFRERGFNQACEIARVLGPRLGLKVLHDRLRRTRATQPQAKLSRAERRRNVRGAFAWYGQPPPKRVALIDDVMTTGETLKAATRALHEAGAHDVAVWVLARA